MSQAKALDILARVTARGALLLRHGDRVRVKAPRRLPASLLAEIETHAAVIARLLPDRDVPADMGAADTLAGARRRRPRTRRPGAGRRGARPMTPPTTDPHAAVLAEALAMVLRGFPVQLYSHALGRPVMVVMDEAARQNRVTDAAGTVLTAAEVEAGALAELGALA